VSAVAEPGARGAVSRHRVLWFGAIALCGVLPAIVLAGLFVITAREDTMAMDFRQFYWAAEQILGRDSPYRPGEPLTAWGGPYPYPPLPALATIPLTVLPFEVAGLLLMVALVLALEATLFVLGVRDWRCYGFVLLWPPVISAIQTANVTLWFGLAAAILWRLRDRPLLGGVGIGVTLATKFFLWPLVVWQAATRRVFAAAVTCGIGLALLLVSWAAIGFAGFRDYPDLLRRLEDKIGADSYTAYIVALDLGAGTAIARAVWLVLGLGLLAAVVVVSRRGNEQAGFILAIAAALALTPIVWLHYFALLVVVVAVAQPRLGVAWFVPLAMVVTPGSGQPTPFETSATLIIAALTIALALRASLAEAREPGARSRGLPTEPAARAV
jgi:hypothetical protein